MPSSPTPRLGLVMPIGDDAADVPLRVKQPFEQIDTLAAIDDQGVWPPPAATPARRGMYWWATDRLALYRCDGANWLLVSARRIKSTSGGTFFNFFSFDHTFDQQWPTGGSADPRPEVTIPWTGLWRLEWSGKIEVQSSSTHVGVRFGFGLIVNDDHWSFGQAHNMVQVPPGNSAGSLWLPDRAVEEHCLAGKVAYLSVCVAGLTAGNTIKVNASNVTLRASPVLTA